VLWYHSLSHGKDRYDVGFDSKIRKPIWSYDHADGYVFHSIDHVTTAGHLVRRCSYRGLQITHVDPK
jgi:hypothetical protein